MWAVDLRFEKLFTDTARCDEGELSIRWKEKMWEHRTSHTLTNTSRMTAEEHLC